MEHRSNDGSCALRIMGTREDSQWAHRASPHLNVLSLKRYARLTHSVQPHAVPREWHRTLFSRSFE